MVCPSGLTSSEIQVPLLVVKVAKRSGWSGSPGLGSCAWPAVVTSAARDRAAAKTRMERLHEMRGLWGAQTLENTIRTTGAGGCAVCEAGGKLQPRAEF